MNRKDTISIFNIKRFAVHDGPGIRTTVFFKGCSLYCPWCQNPEGISKTRNLLFQKSKCIECHSCIEVCPQNAIKTSTETKIEINREKCDLCGICVSHCPTNTLIFDTKEYTVSELVEVLARDLVFFQESKGGVTFSGGEPLLQVSQLAEIAGQLKKKGIHIAVDSALMVPYSDLQKAAGFVDLFIVDIKMLDNKLAKETIGMDLDLYKKNLEFLFANGFDLKCRIPLIPGYTDSSSNIKKIRSFIEELNKKYKRSNSVEPINFNPLSKTKYRQLGQDLPVIRRWTKYSTKEIENFYTLLNHEN